MILFGELAEAGGSVEIGVGSDGELTLTITEKEMATV